MSTGIANIALWEQLSSTAEHLATIAAILLGGIWSYFKFVKGRIFHPRLEPNVAGRILHANNRTYLLAQLKLKNPGASKVELSHSSSALELYYDNNKILDERQLHSLSFFGMPWEEPTSFDVFEEHDWVEANETIEDSKLIVVAKKDHLAIKLELVIDSSKQTFTSTTIIPTEKETTMGNVIGEPQKPGAIYAPSLFRDPQDAQKDKNKKEAEERERRKREQRKREKTQKA